MNTNLILNDFLNKLKSEKEAVKNRLQNIDFDNTTREEIDEQFIYPFRNKYIFTVPDNIVNNVQLSGICVTECINAYLEICDCLNNLRKSS